MPLFNKLKEPVFLNPASEVDQQVDAMKAMIPKLNNEGKTIRDIKHLEYGALGEKQVAFELTNSHMPMYVLRDINLEYNGLNAQIDFIVITRKLIFVIECKNLYGDIEINSKGEFIRTVSFEGRKYREGMYSPIAQNKKHLELMKKIRVDATDNTVFKLTRDRLFDNFNRSVVVLANPKTVLNDRYATKEVKKQVIRADQLIAFIKSECEASKEASGSDDDMLKLAQFYLERNVDHEVDYLKQYEKYMSNNNIAGDSELRTALKAWRLKTCREEGIKAYYIFNDRQIEDLVLLRPTNTNELMNISGFGEKKVEKYGTEIIEIIRSGS